MPINLLHPPGLKQVFILAVTEKFQAPGFTGTR